MYVFLDDSGDAGLKYASGSTELLVMAACIFTTPEDIDAAVEAIRGCRAVLGRSDTFEFKYGKTNPRAKHEFFRAISPLNFTVRAIVITKSLLWSSRVTQSPSELQFFAITQLLTHTNGFIHDAKLTIDGRDAKTFEQRSATRIRKTVNIICPNTLRKVVYADSRQSLPIQLADMVAGAINRHRRTDGREAGVHMAVVRHHARYPHGGIWDFR